MKSMVCCLLLFLAAPVFAADEKAVIEKINQGSKSITSVTAEVEVVIRRRNFAITLMGNLYYERDKNVRLINKNATDGEYTSDIGSNNNYYWIYARRLNRKEMFYGYYKDLPQSNLKESLNPEWMIDGLNIEPIKGGTIQRQQDGKFAVVEKRISTKNTPVYKATLVDPAKMAVIGHYLYDHNGRPMALIVISDGYKTNTGAYLPKKVELKVDAEDVTVTWVLYNIQLNKKIDSSTFKIPNLGLPTIRLDGRTPIQGVND